MADFSLKRNDRLPVISASLKNPDGSAVNLSSVGTTVKFIMLAPRGSTPKINAACTITDATNGVVRYDWAAADVDTSGDYYAEFEVTFPSGLKESYPNTGYLSVSILDDLG